MRRFILALALCLAAAAPAGAQQPKEIPFDSVPNALHLPPDMYLGEVAGVAVNSKGHILVFHRGNTTGPAYGAAAAQLLEFDANGSYLREIGHNLYAWSFAHAVRIDPQDNIWVADKGSDQVIKFDPEGHVAWVFGRKQEASDEGTGPVEHVQPPAPAVDGYFRQVTDMTWDPRGYTYISDGYINSRVARIDPTGQWDGQWGEPGSGPGQFNTVHNIGADAQGRIYVADRGNRRIQVFDGQGALLRTLTIDAPVPADARPAIGARPPATFAPGAAQTMAPGAPWTICITPPPNQVLYVSDAFPGRIYKLGLDGTLLGWLGESGKNLKQFGWVHAIACPSENELYVAELLNWRVQKLELHPGR